jgi:hypothetical protein
MPPRADRSGTHCARCTASLQWRKWRWSSRPRRSPDPNTNTVSRAKLCRRSVLRLGHPVPVLGITCIVAQMLGRPRARGVAAGSQDASLRPSTRPAPGKTDCSALDLQAATTSREKSSRRPASCAPCGRQVVWTSTAAPRRSFVMNRNEARGLATKTATRLYGSSKSR